MIKTLLVVTLISFILAPISVSCQTYFSKSTAKEIIQKHKIVFNSPPTKIPVAHSVDAPLMGNGFTGIAISGKPEKQVYYLARNDFWRLKSSFNQSFPAVLGKLEIEIPGLKQANYHVEQDLYEAKTKSIFSTQTGDVTFESFVSANEDVLVLEIKYSGTGELTGTATLKLPGEDELIDKPPFDVIFPTVTKSGKSDKGSFYILRGFEEDVDIKTQAACAMKVVGLNNNQFTLKEGVPVVIVAALSSNSKSDNCLETTVKRVEEIDTEILKRIDSDHKNWWSAFWGKSYVNIPDKQIEKLYYLSNYTLASCSRDADFPASIFGTWITKERPHWNGDYHLNYNHFAPYYGVFSSNHPELAVPCNNSMLAQLERGRFYSEKVCGIKGGIMLPVGAGPLGIETTRRNELMEVHRKNWIDEGNVQDEGLFYGQKSNSSYAMVNIANHFYFTYDSAYSKKYYPFVKGVATFWEEYLTFENDRYVIYNDAIHEGTVGTKNPILSLGLIRMVMNAAIDMSLELGVDSERHQKWKHILKNLSGYSYQTKNGKKVFRYTEKGTDWWGDNTLGIQHIYPAGQIGFNSDADLLKVAHNTIDVMQRWVDFNGSNSFFPAAVRVGYNPEVILKKLNKYVNNTYPNGFQLNNPHGIENLSTVPNTINEMMCSGYGGVVRIFPVWPKNKNASFYNLRVYGAFLVSARIENEKVTFIKIISENGKQLILQNPFKENDFSCDKEYVEMDGNLIFNLKPGDAVIFKLK